ncbi:GNAT family N-acetyltransferase [Pseudoalteromonas sp. H105]|uniref:GNAT family N-acetyltransferase n=1 Tax=Pseudoalteromonas sp. H105 TaxID=1348393 RepID=UPI0007324142|nr:GNAT family N-acetyltransferase [Pseudoalteromonas sp. H105]KTF13708.1 hypothetical protein ATS75_14140 [Pseudoalteromonas sp. H105]
MIDTTLEFYITQYSAKHWLELCKTHDKSRLIELNLTVGTMAFKSLQDSFEEEELFAGKLFVAENHSGVLGFIAYTPYEISWLYVNPSNFRQGVGTRLLKLALNDTLRPVEVSVLSNNEPAINLYQKCGFDIVKTQTGKLNGFENIEATGHIMVLR